jgi:hypothetical protein
MPTPGFLDLERFVDQVAQDLRAQAFLFLGRDLVAAAVGIDDQRKALVDVGAGDDLAVDDRGGAAMVGSILPKNLGLVGRLRLPSRSVVVAGASTGTSCATAIEVASGPASDAQHQRHAQGYASGGGQQAKDGIHGNSSFLFDAPGADDRARARNLPGAFPDFDKTGLTRLVPGR